MATGGAMSMKEIMAERAQRMKGRERREGQKEETKKESAQPVQPKIVTEKKAASPSSMSMKEIMAERAARMKKNRKPAANVSTSAASGIQKNIWPNEFPLRINESNYTFATLLNVLVKSISGIIFLILSFGLLLWSLITGVEILGSMLMNIGCFCLVFMVIHLIKRKITGTSNDVSITLLFRYYNFTTMCMIILLLSFAIVDLTTMNDLHIFYFAHILFDCSLGLVFILSVIMAVYPGTVRERCMRFLFMWPLNESSETRPNKLIHILWITRQLLQVFVIGYTIIANLLIVDRFSKASKHLFWEYEALNMYFGAAFCEEYFKFFLAASIPFIPKYSKSKSAILHVSIMVGLAFDLVENIKYANENGISVLERLAGFTMHFVFAYPAALAISRQRDSILWIFEVVGGFALGVGIHGTFNYFLTIRHYDENFTFLAYISMPGLFLLGLAVGLYILIKNPFLPKDEFQQSQVNYQV